MKVSELQIGDKVDISKDEHVHPTGPTDIEDVRTVTRLKPSVGDITYVLYEGFRSEQTVTYPNDYEVEDVPDDS